MSNDHTASIEQAASELIDSIIEFCHARPSDSVARRLLWLAVRLDETLSKTQNEALSKPQNRNDDAKLVDELHYYVWTQFAKVPKEQRKPVSPEILYSFLADRVPNDRIDEIIALAESMGRLRKNFGYPGYVPQNSGEPKE